MLISIELYTQLIEQKSYAEGRIAELEKQLEELKRRPKGETMIERYRRQFKENETFNKIMEEKCEK